MIRRLTGLALCIALASTVAAAAAIDPRPVATPALAADLGECRLDAAGADTLDSDCVWECFHCGSLWVGTGLVTGVTVAGCTTGLGCIGGAIGVAITLEAAVDACLDCDRCLHPEPDPGPVPEPECPDGFAPCAPNSPLCCQVPNCPPGFEPCAADPMTCCGSPSCLPPDCPS